MEHEAFKLVYEKDESQMLKNTNAAKVTAGFGAAAATLHAVPELNADVVNLTFSPGTVIFSTDQSKVDVNLGTTGGAFLGSIGQYNDSVGKSMDTNAGIAEPRIAAMLEFADALPKSILISTLATLKTWMELVAGARAAGRRTGGSHTAQKYVSFDTGENTMWLP